MMGRSALFVLFLSGSVSALAVAAAAQEAPGEIAADSFVLGPITVYGDRTTTDADRSLASVAIIGERELDSPTIRSWRDTFRLMGNVQAGDWNENGVIIRGMNSEGQTPGGLGAPLASFYVDGVQQTVNGTRRGVRGTFDTEQFEVFRGPQSTLSGRAALAGAMYLRTRDPDFTRSGAAEVTYGENDRKQVGLAYGSPLGENVAFRIAGEWSEADSTINYPSYRRFDKYDDFTTDEYYTLRGKLLWLPGESDNTRVLFSASHSFDRPLMDDIVGRAWSSNAPGFGARRGDAWGSLVPDWVRAMGATELPAYQEVREATTDNFGLEITHDFSDALTFTSMTGYSKNVTDRDSINVGTPGEFMTVRGSFEQELISQEFRLNYEAGPWRGVAGYYVAQEKQEAWRRQQITSLDNSRNHATITNQAAFGEISYEVLPGFRLIGGGRIDYIRQETDAFFERNGVVTSDLSTWYDDTVLIPKVGMEYDITPNQTVALVYQQGYRPGGEAIRSTDGVPYDYEPEWTHVIEASWRARLLDDRARIAANAFYQEWDDQQIEIRADPSQAVSAYIANAGRSTSYGAEIEASYQATDRLNVFTSIGLLHTEFDDFWIGDTDYSGLPFPAAPEHSVALGYYWGGDTGFFSFGNVKYTGAFMSRIETGVPDPIELDAYTTVDLSAGYAWDQARVTLYATNLFDEQYYTYEYGPDSLATLGEGREIGLRLNYTF